MKKFISLLLVMVLSLMQLVIPTHASDLMSLSVGSSSVASGETIIIPISITSNPGFVSMSLYLTYDMTALTLISCDDTGLIEGGEHSPYFTSPYMLTWENDILNSDITKTGTIVNLTFLVNDNAKEGDYSIIIRIPTDGILNANGDSVYAENAMGIITVAEEHECTFGEWEYFDPKKHIRYCEDCEKEETRNHNWNDGEIVVKPTHEDEGEVLYTCEYCGAEKSEEISPIEHAYSLWTNFDDKQHKRECDCGDVEYEDHSWDNGVVTKQPTSTASGTKTYTCEECGATKTEAIPPNYVSVTGVNLSKDSLSLSIGASDTITATVLPSNATNKNVTWKSLNEAVASVVNGVVTANRAGTAIITVTTEDGGYEASCVITVEAGPPVDSIITFDKQTIELVLDGDFSEVIKATILPEGEIFWMNSNDSVVDMAFFDETSVLVVGLAPGTAIITASDSTGTVKAQCVVTVVGSGEVHTHSYISKVTPPTCTEKGYTTYTCSCGDTYIADYVDATGHSHTSKVTAPTCTAQGYTTYTCSCGHSYKDNYTNATGHSYSNGSCTKCGTVDPDYSADAPTISLPNITSTAGSTVRVPVVISNNPGIASVSITITYDDSVLTLVEIEDAGLISGAVHSPTLSSPYQLTWMNPTISSNITSNGTMITLVFEIADDVQAGDYTIDVSYDFDNYDIVNVDMEPVRFATIGSTVTVIDWLYGDVNNDGRVNMLDGTILARHVAKWPDYTSDKLNMLAADVNNDGKVNMLDSTILARHIAKWPDYAALPFVK